MACQAGDLALTGGWLLALVAFVLACAASVVASWRVRMYRKTLEAVTLMYQHSLALQAADYAEGLTLVRADYERQVAALKGRH